jgi:hypothetical protein
MTNSQSTNSSDQSDTPSNSPQSLPSEKSPPPEVNPTEPMFTIDDMNTLQLSGDTNNIQTFQIEDREV